MYSQKFIREKLIAPGFAPQNHPGTSDQTTSSPFLEELKSQQKLGFGTLAGLSAAVAGSFLWAAVMAISLSAAAWMAIVMGLMVGGALRTFGRGVEARFGILAILITLMGCLLGKILGFSLLGIAGQHWAFPELLSRSFSGWGIAWCAAALLPAYFISFKSIEKFERAFNEREDSNNPTF